MIHLLGDVAALPGGHAEKKQFLMDGLCRLIHADVWTWTLACQFEPNKPPVYVGYAHGGFSQERFAKYLTAVEDPSTQVATFPFITEFQAKGAHHTRHLDELAEGQCQLFIEQSPLWRAVGLKTSVFSAYPLDDRCVSAIAIFRNLGAGLFTRRESLIAHIILSEIPWLHEQGWPEDRGVKVPHLSPRKRLILNFLLDNRSRKEIADDIGISVNTVGAYINEIYRHFRVQSHAELIKRFFRPIV